MLRNATLLGVKKGEKHRVPFNLRDHTETHSRIWIHPFTMTPWHLMASSAPARLKTDLIDECRRAKVDRMGRVPRI